MNNVEECDCQECCGYGRVNRHSHKCAKLAVFLLGGIVGAFVGVKYHKELTKAAYQSWNITQKNKDLYLRKADKKANKLKKRLKK